LINFISEFNKTESFGSTISVFDNMGFGDFLFSEQLSETFIIELEWKVSNEQSGW